MTYDFDTVVDRQGLSSAKWSVGAGELPMWVADMDFAAAPPIARAVAERAARPSFGYTETAAEWAPSVATYWQTRHSWPINPTHIAFCTGVIPALASTVRTLTGEGESVLLQSPVYNHFYTSITNSGRVIASNDLLYDGQYHIDWEDLESKLTDPATKLFFLCNPHNPTGQIWTAEELSRMGSLAATHKVVVLSDEIHCDITHPDVLYTPFAVAAPDCPAVICVSPTKTFSIPGLQTSAVIVEDDALRQQVFAGLNRDEIGEPNSFAIGAAIAAFKEGGQWVDEMRAYVQKNKDQATEAIEALGLHVVPSQSTYLLWIDCATLVGEQGNATQFCHFMREKTGLFVAEGEIYRGDRFFRLNVGCPRSLVEDGLTRLTKAVELWRNQ